MEEFKMGKVKPFSSGEEIVLVAESFEKQLQREKDRREALGEEGRKDEDEQNALRVLEEHAPTLENKCTSCGGEVVLYFRSYNPQCGGDVYSLPMCISCNKMYFFSRPNSHYRVIGSRGEWIERRSNLMKLQFTM